MGCCGCCKYLFLVIVFLIKYFVESIQGALTLSVSIVVVKRPKTDKIEVFPMGTETTLTCSGNVITKWISKRLQKQSTTPCPFTKFQVAELLKVAWDQRVGDEIGAYLLIYSY